MVLRADFSLALARCICASTSVFHVSSAAVFVILWGGTARPMAARSGRSPTLGTFLGPLPPPSVAAGSAVASAMESYHAASSFCVAAFFSATRCALVSLWGAGFLMEDAARGPLAERSVALCAPLLTEAAERDGGGVERVHGVVVLRERRAGLGGGARAGPRAADGGARDEDEREHRERDEPAAEDHGRGGELVLAARLAVEETWWVGVWGAGEGGGVGA